MTPDEAVVELRNNGVIFGSNVGVRLTIEACVATETQQCVTRAKAWIDRRPWSIERKLEMGASLETAILAGSGLEIKS